MFERGACKFHSLDYWDSCRPHILAGLCESKKKKNYSCIKQMQHSVSLGKRHLKKWIHILSLRVFTIIPTQSISPVTPNHRTIEFVGGRSSSEIKRKGICRHNWKAKNCTEMFSLCTLGNTRKFTSPPSIYSTLRPLYVRGLNLLFFDFFVAVSVKLSGLSWCNMCGFVMLYCKVICCCCRCRCCGWWTKL